MNIIFTDTIGVPEAYRPTPASENIPDWYKSMESYLTDGKITNGNGLVSSTIKRCMPVFDAITSGYILYTYVDVSVSQHENGARYEWPDQKPIELHKVAQAPEHPNRKPKSNFSDYPKWMNAWGIKTPKGYSCLFISPSHRKLPFSILEGVVDTDKFDSPVNFPFTFKDETFEGIIPAGTPMAQVIPFKRELWKMSIGKEENLKEQKKTNLYLGSSFFDSYKNKFRTLKEYK